MSWSPEQTHHVYSTHDTAENFGEDAVRLGALDYVIEPYDEEYWTLTVEWETIPRDLTEPPRESFERWVRRHLTPPFEDWVRLV